MHQGLENRRLRIGEFGIELLDLAIDDLLMIADLIDE